MTIFDEILLERKRQDDKWGEQRHNPYKWLAILMEEVGEVAQAALDQNAYDYRGELIQVAAVAVNAIESWDKGNN